jgi:hypothetical protein
MPTATDGSSILLSKRMQAEEPTEPRMLNLLKDQPKERMDPVLAGIRAAGSGVGVEMLMASDKGVGQ